MNCNDLATVLRKSCDEAPQDEKVVRIHLFGIKYADQIEVSGATAHDIVKLAGINDSYGTEVRKGMNLAKYVRVI